MLSPLQPPLPRVLRMPCPYSRRFVEGLLCGRHCANTWGHRQMIRGRPCQGPVRAKAPGRIYEYRLSYFPTVRARGYLLKEGGRERPGRQAGRKRAAL